MNTNYNEHFDVAAVPDRLQTKMGPTAAPVNATIPSDPQSLMEVAKRTGGQTCSDIPTKCVQKIQADATHYYLLGFYLHGESRPGWHSLKVNVQQPGASTRTRQGFIVGEKPSLDKSAALQSAGKNGKGKKKDEPEVSSAEAADKEFINAVLASPLDYTGVPLQLSWSDLPLEGKDKRIELLLTSPPTGVALDPNNRMNLDYLAFVRKLGKTEGQTYPDTLAATLSAAQRQGLEETGFRYRHKLNLAPGRYEVRVLLRDNVANKIGTVSTVIELKQ